MKNHIFLILILSGCLLLSCKAEKHRNDINGVTVLTFTENALDSVSENALKPTKTIQLETTDHSLIQPTAILQSCNQNIFVFDKSAGNVKRFDSHGKFLNEIGSVGQGPNEYIEPNDFLYDEKNKTIEILAVNNIYIYQEDGQFIETKSKNNIPAFSFAKDGAGNYWFATGNNKLFSEYKLHEFTPNAKINSFVKSEDDLIPLQEKNLTDNGIHGITYYESLSSTVYKVIGDSAKISYQIDFGKYSLPDKQYRQNSGLFLDALRKKDCCQIRGYLENNDYACLLIFRDLPSKQKMDFFYWFVNKNTNKNALVKVITSGLDSYLLYPEAMTNDNELVFLGYTEDNSMSQNNPALFYVPVGEFVKKFNEDK